MRPTGARARGPGKLIRETRDGETAWVLDYTEADGRRRRRKLSADRRVAEKMRAELIARRDRAASGLGIIGGQERLLSELRDGYLEYLRLHAGAGHLSNKAARLDKALQALRARRVGELSPSDAIALQGAFVRQGLGNTSVNMRIGALSSMLGWATRMHLIEENPIRHVRPLPINEKTLRRRTRALTEDEMVRLMAAAEDEDRSCCVGGPRQIPQAPFLLAALKTGCRYGELRLLTWGAVDLERNMLLVRGETAKSARSREIPVHAELRDALLRLRELHGRFLGREVNSADRVFLAARGSPWLECSNNANRLLYRLLEKAGIVRRDEAGRQFSVHGLRHSFCTSLATHGATLEHARVLMGHADVRLTSRVYSHLEAEATRTAIDALPALGKVEASQAVPTSRLRLA